MKFFNFTIFEEKNSSANSSGFTIIETLVAITILMVAIVGPLTVAYKGLAASVYARDQMIASYLAQDALEYVKNVRDNNKLASPVRSWLWGLDSCSSTSGTSCRIDTQIGLISSCLITDPCSRLYLDNMYGYNHQNQGIPSQFSRVVTILPPTDTNTNSEAMVRVTVAWKNGTVSNKVVLENQFFDIYR